MIPIRDDQPCSSFAWVNYFIIAANTAVFGYEISLGLHSRALYEFWAQRPDGPSTAMAGGLQKKEKRFCLSYEASKPKGTPQPSGLSSKISLLKLNTSGCFRNQCL